jgi:hypothetical protein
VRKSPVHFERNSENSDLAVSINNNFSKADAQELIVSGRGVPEIEAKLLFQRPPMPSF